MLKREIRAGMTGSDVEGAGRALCRSGFYVPIRVFQALPAAARQRAHRSFVNAVKKLQRAEGWPADGVYGKHEHQALLDAGAFDQKALALYRSWKPPEPPKSKLIEPRHGWSSLHRSLWEPYSIAISTIGGYDLGTYNPRSKLPSGRPSDHAVYPAMAFDIGFRPWTGWWNPAARRGFWKMAEHPAVEYVILGDRIHSKTGGLWRYTGGGHLNHMHVSGHR